MKEIVLCDNGDCNDDILGNYRVIKDGMDDIILIRNMQYKKIIPKRIGIMDVGDEYVVEVCNNRNKYVVKPLDTLSSIAKKFNISEQELIEINNLKYHRLYIGQLLEI